MSKYAEGGFVGPGSPTNDTIPAMLHGCSVHAQPHPKRLIRDSDGNIECDGEWVISASAVRGCDEATGIRTMLARLNDGEGA